MTTCKHDFDCRVGVAMFEDKPGNGSVEISGACRHCGVPLVFYGQRGVGSTQPMASVDRLELRAPVTFGYEPKFVASPDFMINGAEIVALGQRKG